MGKAKKTVNPVQQVARQILRDKGDAFGHQYLRVVRPIGIEYNEERAELIGSAVLLGIGDRRFVITAGHVADWAEKGTLMIGGVSSFMALPPLQTSTHPGNRDKDPYDIAVSELDPETVAGLGAVRFLTPEELDVNSHAVSTRFYTVIGYPVVHQRHDAQRRHFNPMATVFTATPLPETDYRRISTGLFTLGSNLILRFDPTKVVTREGIRALKSQKGLSGGGVWRLESLVDPTAPDRLVGITIYVQRVGLKALVATRINLFLAAILYAHPELARYVSESQTLSISTHDGSTGHGLTN